jgi:hypothetical protein
MDTAEEVFSAIQLYGKAISKENFSGLILGFEKRILRPNI